MWWKQLLFSAGRSLLDWGFDLLFNFIDKDQNGQISKEELDLILVHINFRFRQLSSLKE